MSGAPDRSSGVAFALARMMIGRRVLPSKYSPSHAPSPTVRMTVPSVARSQPTSAMRRSFGSARSSSCESSGFGKLCTAAPGNALSRSLRPSTAARLSASVSSLCRCRPIERAEPPMPEKRSPSNANARVSGSPATIFSRTMVSSSPIRFSSTTRAPIVPPPGQVSRYQFLSFGWSLPSMYGFMRSSRMGASSRFTDSGLIPGGNSKNASMAARFTGGR